MEEGRQLKRETYNLAEQERGMRQHHNDERENERKREREREIGEVFLKAMFTLTSMSCLEEREQQFILVTD